jgi:hypothetical protein
MCGEGCPLQFSVVPLHHPAELLRQEPVSFLYRKEKKRRFEFSVLLQRHRPGKRREDTACVVPTAPGEFGAEADCVTGDAGVCKHAH